MAHLYTPRLAGWGAKPAEPAEIWLKDGDRKTSAVGYEAIGETPLLGLAALGLGGPAEEQG
jgi:hypothetical protein